MKKQADFGRCPVPYTHEDRVLLGHGSGGKLSADLIRDLFLPAFSNPALDRMEDQAKLPWDKSGLAITTDSYVVHPIEFPGGDIGSLAVNGTVNDLAVGGAEPRYLTAAFILEEGLSFQLLERVVRSMARAAKEAGVEIVTGDTKVVNKGSGDLIFINTTGVGQLKAGIELGMHRVKVGDRILISGTMGDHGITILSNREGFGFESDLQSDCAPLNGLVNTLLEAVPGVHCMRDPTRGGLTAVLNEIALDTGLGIEIREKEIPLRPEVKGACELLGLDPLYIANEGKLVAFVPPETAGDALAALRSHPLGKNAVCIGEVMAEPAGMVSIITDIGSQRILSLPLGELLPRIC